MSDKLMTCQYKNHEVSVMALCHYWDDDNGIDPHGIKMCRECYAEHIGKFYPDSRIAAHIKAYPENYRNNQ